MRRGGGGMNLGAHAARVAGGRGVGCVCVGGGDGGVGGGRVGAGQALLEGGGQMGVCGLWFAGFGLIEQGGHVQQGLGGGDRRSTLLELLAPLGLAVN